MKKRKKDIVAVLLLFVLSFSGILSAEDKKNDESSLEKSDIAAAIASVMAERALKANLVLSDSIKSMWTPYQTNARNLFNDTQSLLYAAMAEENRKKPKEKNKEFLKEAEERRSKFYRDWQLVHITQILPAWIADRSEILKKQSALEHYFKYLKGIDTYARNSEMDMSNIALLYKDIEVKAKSIAEEIKEVNAKVKAKDAEMKAISDDSKLWIDIHFGRNKK
ncbi:MAG: hypothetical protein HRT89_24955 [Lentisphaeria bacterium]|nr:hypothetical protein [Lentisphaeria bacterium]NQZ71308.1 hypothetical protein [Lentisphaeria bacterium]